MKLVQDGLSKQIVKVENKLFNMSFKRNLRSICNINLNGFKKLNNDGKLNKINRELVKIDVEYLDLNISELTKRINIINYYIDNINYIILDSELRNIYLKEFIFLRGRLNLRLSDLQSSNNKIKKF